MQLYKKKSDYFCFEYLNNLDLISEQWEDGELDDSDISVILNLNCSFYYQRQMEIYDFLMSFDFEFELEDINVYFEDLENQNLENFAANEFEKVDMKQLAKFLKKLFKENEKTNSEMKAKSSFRKTKKIFKSILMKMCIITYKILSKGYPLSTFCTVLNKIDKLSFSSNFWSEWILINIIYKYSSVDLKCKITHFLSKLNTMPLLLNPSSESTQITPFIEYFIKPKIGVLSYSIGRNSNKIGKSKLLNELLYTTFSIKTYDPFGSKKVEIDMAQNFYPERPIAVIDCNHQDFEFFEMISKMINLVLLNVHFKDLINDMENTQFEIKRISDYCKNHNIFLIVFIRDWNDLKNVNITQEKVFEYRPEDDKENTDHSSPSRIFNELKQYEKFYKEKKENKKLNKSKLKRNLFDRLKSLIKKKKLFGKNDNVLVKQIKNLKNMDRSKYQKHCEILKKDVNEQIDFS
jgi:hypothetical protein